MVQYIFENAFSFGIGIIFVISTLILGIVFLLRARKQEGLTRYTTLIFSLSLLFFFAAHTVWTYRSAFIPQHPSLFVIFPYWQGFWILFMMGVTLIGIWSVLLSYPEWLETRKWILGLIFIPWIIVTLDTLFLANPAVGEWVCSALITDMRPDLLHIFVVGLSLTLFIGIVLGYYYQQLKDQERKLMSFLTLFGLLLILIGGLLETRVIPICQFITVGRMLMLIGIWLTSYGILFHPLVEITPKSEK